MKRDTGSLLRNLLLAGVACLIAATASAQLPGYSARSTKQKYSPQQENTAYEFLQSFDENGDGQISKTEFLKAYETMFEIMDVSGDGKIDTREMRRDPARTFSSRARWAAGTITRYDTDGDGKLSKDEAPFWTRAFTRADANKDGLVDKRELTQFAFELALLNEGLYADNPAKAAAAFLKKYDKNKDGKIAADEFDWGEDVFRRYDRNKNGVLDADEVGRIPALPPSPKQKARELLKQRDRDGDGQLSAAEFGESPQRFHSADINGDGRLSLDELTKMLAPPNIKAKPARGKRLQPPLQLKGGPTLKPEKRVLLPGRKEKAQKAKASVKGVVVGPPLPAKPAK